MELTAFCKNLPYGEEMYAEKLENRGRMSLKKLLLIMRITAILLLAAVLNTSAKTFSQKITISAKDVSIEKAFSLLKQQTGYSFLWNDQLLSKSHRISLDVKQGTLAQALDQCLKDLPLTYQIKNNIVYIVKKPEEKPESAEKSSVLTAFRDIRGRVTDSSGQPLAGANITIKGTDRVTTTNEQGEFVLAGVNNDVTLVITMAGYSRREIKAGNNSVLNIVLEARVNELDDMVVTGYQTQQRRSVTGAIATVKGREIENMPVQSFDKAIQGRAAGVLVQTATGVPGGAVRINIRGIGSIGAGTEPMYIVDGVQLNTETPSSRTSTNVMAYINPNDIESIEILKDAAAAAIYGSQAANGVILITTKKGKAGKTTMNLNYYQGISAPPKNLKVLSSQDLIALRTEALMNANPTANINVMKAQALSELGVSPDLTDEEIAALPTYDWQSEAFKRGSVRNIEFSASGGTAKSTFYVSGAYNKHDGNVTGIDFEKGTAKMRMGQEINERLSLDFGVNLSVIKQNGNTGSQGSTSGSASPQYTAAYMPPTIPIYNEDGSFNAYQGMPGTGFNPIQAATVDDNIVKHRAVVGNFSATYKILKNLSFRSFYGLDYRYVRADYYRDPRTPNGATVNGYLINDNSENVNFSTNQTLNYKTTLKEDHTISVIAGAEYRSDVSEYQSARAQGFPTYQYRTNASAAEAFSVTGSWSGNRRLGFFGQANYAFMDKYFVTGVLRYDGSSRFGVDKKMGLFPGISAGWDIAREAFLSKTHWINQLKLRAGYGKTGNDQINDVSSRGLYQGGVSYNGDAGIRLQTIANPDLGWEGNITANLGLDYSLFDRRIYGAIEVYSRKSDNLILGRELPYTSGFSSVSSNLGQVVNKGLEIDINTVNIRRGDFSWTTNFNIAFLKNELTKLYDTITAISNTRRVGYPLTIWYRPRYAGVNAANGRPMWYDVNGNITYLIGGADNVPTNKGWQSDYFGGFSNTFSYKGFELNVLFHYDMGKYMANTQYQVLANVMTNPGRNTLQQLYDERWTTPGQITTVPRPIAGGAEKNSSAQASATTRFLEDASFVRLRELTLSYQFTPEVLKNLKLTRARIYVTGVNLYTWTKWTGYDPEFAIMGSVTDNQGIVPQTASVTAGIQLSF